MEDIKRKERKTPQQQVTIKARDFIATSCCPLLPQKREQIQKIPPDKDIMSKECLLVNKTSKPMAINTHPKEMDHRQTGKGKLLKLALQPPRGSAEFLL